MKNVLIDSLRQMAEIKEEEVEIILNLFTEKNYKAKTYLLREGEVCRKMYFIKKGLARVSLLDRNSRDITFNFRYASQFLTDYESFETQQPAVFSISALEDMECFEISKEDFDTMCQLVASGELITRIVVYYKNLLYMNRLISFYKETPEERYIKLLEENPSLINRIPQKYLASYIGIEPQSFSRIKRRYMEAQKTENRAIF